MSSDTAISVRNLGKSYILNHQKVGSYKTLSESLVGGVKKLKGMGGKENKSSRETFWALKDISFDVAKGQVYGVIGRNGAGKSTLLKILSRITEPTTGHAEIYGRVGSLLEVGTGFHPELTGRENIYLNGTLLGMRKKQIDRVFDEIVAFSEVERFLDTPVKRYSSGMYVRLAFAVAAHLEPDILIIDEVLAVGDFQFQKKCLGKMKDVTGDGRTVLFVSHNLTTINTLCDRCLLLNQGGIELEGPTETVTKSYFAGGAKNGGALLYYTGNDRPGDDIAKLCSARLINVEGEAIEFARIDQKIGVEMVFEILGSPAKTVPNLHFFTQGQCAFVSARQITEPLSSGVHRVVAWIPECFLNEGIYIVNLALTTMSPQKVHFHEQDSFYFNVVDNLYDEKRNGYVHAIPGVIRPILEWELE
jgi:lipopolysaccharide transport system ATP-binding protein